MAQPSPEKAAAERILTLGVLLPGEAGYRIERLALEAAAREAERAEAGRGEEPAEVRKRLEEIRDRAEKTVANIDYRCPSCDQPMVALPDGFARCTNSETPHIWWYNPKSGRLEYPLVSAEPLSRAYLEAQADLRFVFVSRPAAPSPDASLREALQLAREALHRVANDCYVQTPRFILDAVDAAVKALSAPAARPDRERERLVMDAAFRLLDNKYLHWTEAGGPRECLHGIAAGIPCRLCDEGTVAAYRSASAAGTAGGKDEGK